MDCKNTREIRNDLLLHVKFLYCSVIIPACRSSFSEGPEKFSHPESSRKISNLMTTELFYLHILNINTLVVLGVVVLGVLDLSLNTD